MVDIVDNRTRSRMMAGIKAKDTRPELRLRKALHAAGFRYRIHVRQLPGRPDIVLPRFRAAVQVNGCFWHRHAGCRHATTPATRSEFWREKFAANVARDDRNLALLQAAGWRTAVVWECGLRARDIGTLLEDLSVWIRSEELSIELP